VTELPAPTDDELRKLSEYLYRRTGMMFTEAKRYYLERRIWERMAATGSKSFTSYFALLRTDTHEEIQHFVNAFTVNETYFYREDHQLKCLTNELMQERVNGKRAGETIRIWSTPCATGEEPYSLAIWLLEHWSRVDDYEIEIVGSDIDTRALEAARAGIFGKRALMRLTPELIGKYFEAFCVEQWRIIAPLRDSVSFTSVNLVEAEQTRAHGRFDVIFCRNVLIYFDDASRRVAAENLYENLLPGGFVCLGHAESMSRISSLFEVRRFADTIVYQRPEATGA
jgi:chemotaxis protein methyltransferase CheR